MRRKIRVGAAAAAAALALSSCAGDAQGGAAGETLVVGSLFTPRHLNSAIQSGFATALPATQLFASPVRYGSDFEPQPYLAESWETSANGKTVTLDLVDDAVFHDGEPITSADVAFSIDVIKNNHPFGQAMLGPIQSVETPDEQTAVIKLRAAHPALMLAMSPALMPIIPEHVYGDGADLLTHPRNGKDVVGSGPYELIEHVEGEQVVLKAFDDFFLDEEPIADQLVVKMFSDEDSLALAMESGQVSMAALTAPATLSRLEKSDGIIVQETGFEALGSLNFLEFNTARPPLDDVRVRQAISYAIDVDYIINELHRGYSNPAPSPIHPGSPLFNPDVNTYPQNLAKTAALLDKAGFPSQGDSPRLSLTLDYAPGATAYQLEVAEVIKSQLAEAGIAVKIRNAPDLSTWGSRVSNYDFDMSMDNVWNWGDPVIGVHRSYSCSNIRKGVLWANMGQYCNEQVDRLMSEAATEPDPEKRKELYAEFQEIVVNEAPMRFLTDLPYVLVHGGSVTNPPVGIWGLLAPMLTSPSEDSASKE
jgi:peptide/nickel transport system substrate-binding protein